MMSHTHIAVGRRKTSVARVVLRPGSGTFTINNRTLEQYFPGELMQNEVLSPLKVTDTHGKYDVLANVDGGGLHGQAGALKLSISRALIRINEDFRAVLRTNGMVTRDPRMVERKKYGQRKARKRFQFSKR